jgi:DNA-binding MarR family transcriptional regulator
MDTAWVSQVRHFNRAVTQRVGALNDRFLARNRSLGESRVLWEIGPDGCDVREIRTRLDLDSGYLSRLLRSLEAAGLVAVHPGDPDRRVRTARLTPSGLAERALLDRLSDELACSLLEPLTEPERVRLVHAMGEVERLLAAAQVQIAPIDPMDPQAQYCLREYFAELDRRFEGGFDPSRSPSAEEFRPPSGLFLVASLRSEPIGCGALKFHEAEPAEIKRMWVAPGTRGLGIGRRLLGELERRAAASGAREVRLDTNAALTEAVGLYRSAGYVDIEPFHGEPYAHHWFGKEL